jgi:DNA-binding NarL/FixJ family response regulator
VKNSVLIVDDNSGMRQTTRRILEKTIPSLCVFEAENGEDAFTQVHNHLPLLILMDIRLPGENGLKLTKKIKDIYPEVVIIIFTNHDLPEYREAAFENGADFFLPKASQYKSKLTEVVESIIGDAL